MAFTSSILIYGPDLTLLDTRRWVLERAGFRVNTVSDLSNAVEAMTIEAHSLIVLCHTLTAAEHRAVNVVAGGFRPPINTLSIYTERRRNEEDRISGDTLDSFAGADGLIAAARKMLE